MRLSYLLEILNISVYPNGQNPYIHTVICVWASVAVLLIIKVIVIKVVH